MEIYTFIFSKMVHIVMYIMSHRYDTFLSTIANTYRSVIVLMQAMQVSTCSYLNAVRLCCNVDVRDHIRHR